MPTEGLDLGGFSLATILIAVFFGLVGFAAFRYGRKNGETRPLLLGVALMAYGYFVSNAWVSLGVGAVLTLLLFFPRDPLNPRGAPMNTREYFSQCFKAEKDKFLRVLKAVPSDKTAYKPHERSTSAGDLVWLIASEWDDARAIIDEGKVNFVVRPAPARVADSVAAFEKNADAIETRMAKVDDAAWTKNAQFLMDGNVAWEAPLGDMLFGFLFDAIHHRGQLSAYLRPMGAKVPSIYGPSADDPGA